jgi:putative membrane protein
MENENLVDEATTSSEDQLYQKLTLGVKIVSIVLPVAVALLFGLKLEVNWPFDVYYLPMINAILNGASGVLLIGALIAVKQKNIKLHTRLIYTAMAFSLIFLVIYILYHITTGHTSFGGTGTIRTIYFGLLITHIILAAIQAPFVLFAFLYGYTGQIEKHKKIVKFSFPIWLYVSVTGVICYLMISPYYPS